MIIHERTKTSREVRGIEKELAKSLERVARQIRSDPLFPNNVGMLQEKYGAFVMSKIQEAVQKSYIAALNYVSEYEGVQALLSQKDVANIQRIAQSEAGTFWRAVTRDSVNIQAPNLVRKVNVGAMAGLVATATTAGTLAVATIDKAQEMGDDSEVVWITSLDERVCPICRPLHKKTWRLNDPLLLKPIEHTHPNCRCRLLFKDGREVFSH